MAIKVPDGMLDIAVLAAVHALGSSDFRNVPEISKSAIKEIITAALEWQKNNALVPDDQQCFKLRNKAIAVNRYCNATEPTDALCLAVAVDWVSMMYDTNEEPTLIGKTKSEWTRHIDTLFSSAKEGEDIPKDVLLYAFQGKVTEDEKIWAGDKIAEIEENKEIDSAVEEVMNVDLDHDAFRRGDDMRLTATKGMAEKLVAAVRKEDVKGKEFPKLSTNIYHSQKSASLWCFAEHNKQLAKEKIAELEAKKCPGLSGTPTNNEPYHPKMEQKAQDNFSSTGFSGQATSATVVPYKYGYKEDVAKAFDAYRPINKNTQQQVDPYPTVQDRSYARDVEDQNSLIKSEVIPNLNNALFWIEDMEKVSIGMNIDADVKKIMTMMDKYVDSIKPMIEFSIKTLRKINYELRLKCKYCGGSHREDACGSGLM